MKPNHPFVPRSRNPLDKMADKCVWCKQSGKKHAEKLKIDPKYLEEK